MLIFNITKALVVVLTASVSYSISRCNTGIHGFETARIHHRSFASLDRSGIRPTPIPSSSSSVLGLSNSNNENNNRNQNAEIAIDSDYGSDYGRGLLVLATVPMAWGTFEPAVRLVYKYEPLMPPLVFSFAYYFVATSILTTIGALRPSSLDWGATPRDTEPESILPATVTKTNSGFGFVSGLPLSTRGGIELGTYLFLGNVFQVIGLKTVPSDRAAFLLQLTTLFVPLLKGWTEDTVIPLATWNACGIALLGVAAIGLDNGAGIGAGIRTSYGELLDQAFHQLPAFSVEDGYIVMAAVFYTFHRVRLENYARSTASALDLATAKATTELLWSGVAILGCAFAAVVLGAGNGNDGVIVVSTSSLSPGIVDMARISGDKILSYGDGIREQISSSSLSSTASGNWPRVGTAILWVGAVTVAYTIYAQSFGQSRVPAVTANLMYSSQPIFTALVAYGLLGERLGPNGFLGGTLIGAAVLLVIATEAKTETETVIETVIEPSEMMTETDND